MLCLRYHHVPPIDGSVVLVNGGGGGMALVIKPQGQQVFGDHVDRYFINKI